MKYTLLNAHDQRMIRIERLRELEAHHYRLMMEEAEEAKPNDLRIQAITDLERRISLYQGELNPDEMAGDSTERGGEEVFKP